VVTTSPRVRTCSGSRNDHGDVLQRQCNIAVTLNAWFSQRVNISPRLVEKTPAARAMCGPRQESSEFRVVGVREM